MILLYFTLLPFTASLTAFGYYMGTRRRLKRDLEFKYNEGFRAGRIHGRREMDKTWRARMRSRKLRLLYAPLMEEDER